MNHKHDYAVTGVSDSDNEAGVDIEQMDEEEFTDNGTYEMLEDPSSEIPKEKYLIGCFERFRILFKINKELYRYNLPPFPVRVMRGYNYIPAKENIVYPCALPDLKLLIEHNEIAKTKLHPRLRLYRQVRNRASKIYSMAKSLNGLSNRHIFSFRGLIYSIREARQRDKVLLTYRKDGDVKDLIRLIKFVNITIRIKKSMDADEHYNKINFIKKFVEHVQLRETKLFSENDEEIKFYKCMRDISYIVQNIRNGFFPGFYKEEDIHLCKKLFGIHHSKKDLSEFDDIVRILIPAKKDFLELSK